MSKVNQVLRDDVARIIFEFDLDRRPWNLDQAKALSDKVLNKIFAPIDVPQSVAAVSYRTEGKYNNKWETVIAGFKTQDEAELSFADAARYPLDRLYRIVEVVETVVFE